MNLPDAEPTTVASVVAALVGSILYFRRKASTDNVAISKDDAERGTIAFLQSERDKYMNQHEETLTKLRDAEVKVERLTGQVERLTADKDRMALQITTCEGQLRQLRRIVLQAMPEQAGEIFRSDFGELTPTPKEK